MKRIRLLIICIGLIGSARADDYWFKVPSHPIPHKRLAPATISAASGRPDSFNGAVQPLKHVYYDQPIELHPYDKWGHVDLTSSAMVYVSVSSDAELGCGVEGNLRVLLQTQGSQLWDIQKSMRIGMGLVGIQYTDDSISIPRFPRQLGYTVKPGDVGVHQLYDTTPEWKQAAGMLELGAIALLDPLTLGAASKSKTMGEMAGHIDRLKEGIPSECELLRLNDRYDQLALMGWNIYDSTKALRDTDFTERAFDIPFSIGKQTDWEINLVTAVSAVLISNRERGFLRKDNEPVQVRIDFHSRPLSNNDQTTLRPTSITAFARQLVDAIARDDRTLMRKLATLREDEFLDLALMRELDWAPEEAVEFGRNKGWPEQDLEKLRRYLSDRMPNGYLDLLILTCSMKQQLFKAWPESGYIYLFESVNEYRNAFGLSSLLVSG